MLKKLRKENAIARNNLTENVQTNNSVENNKNIKNQVLDLTRDCYYLLSLLNKLAKSGLKLLLVSKLFIKS